MNEKLCWVRLISGCSSATLASDTVASGKEILSKKFYIRNLYSASSRPMLKGAPDQGPVKQEGLKEFVERCPHVLGSEHRSEGRVFHVEGPVIKKSQRCLKGADGTHFLFVYELDDGQTHC
jgi:hypothetical protein